MRERILRPEEVQPVAGKKRTITTGLEQSGTGIAGDKRRKKKEKKK